jgi:hypothetical protein
MQLLVVALRRGLLFHLHMAGLLPALVLIATGFAFFGWEKRLLSSFVEAIEYTAAMRGAARWSRSSLTSTERTCAQVVGEYSFIVEY